MWCVEVMCQSGKPDSVALALHDSVVCGTTILVACACACGAVAECGVFYTM